MNEVQALKVHIEIVAVSGEDGAAFRAAQASVIHKILQWIGDEHVSTDESAEADRT